MRFVQPAVVLLGAPMYFGLFFVLNHMSGDDDGGTVSPWWVLVIVGGWNLLLFIASILAIIDSAVRVHSKRTRQLAVDGMVVKLAAIPFFLVNAMILVFIFNFGVAWIALFGLALWVIVAIGVVLTYLTMLSTSVYLWATITQLRRERAIGAGLTILYVILSLLFVTDVAAAVLLFGHSRRRPRLALIWLFVAVGLAMIGFGLFEWHEGSDFFIFLVPILPFFGFTWLEWGIPAIAGTAVILATVVVGVVRRKGLQLEAQRAAEARAAQGRPHPPLIAQ